MRLGLALWYFTFGLLLSNPAAAFTAGCALISRPHSGFGYREAPSPETYTLTCTHVNFRTGSSHHCHAPRSHVRAAKFPETRHPQPLNGKAVRQVWIHSRFSVLHDPCVHRSRPLEPVPPTPELYRNGRKPRPIDSKHSTQNTMQPLVWYWTSHTSGARVIPGRAYVHVSSALAGCRLPLVLGVPLPHHPLHSTTTTHFLGLLPPISPPTKARILFNSQH